MTTSVLIWVLLFAAGVAVFSAYAYTGKFYRCFFFSLFTGLGALGVVWVLGHFFTVNLTVTPLSVIASALLGVPGVVGMLVLGIV